MDPLGYHCGSQLTRSAGIAGNAGKRVHQVRLSAGRCNDRLLSPNFVLEAAHSRTAVNVSTRKLLNFHKFEILGKDLPV